MKAKITLLPILLVMVVALTFGCSKSDEKEGTAQQASPSYKTAAPAAPASPAGVKQGGIVREIVDAEGYTYLSLEDSEKIRFWVAVPAMDVKVGDGVEIFGATPMPNFYSKSLDKTFDTILFANSATVLGQMAPSASAGQLPPDHPPLPSITAEVKKVAKAEGGHTVAELFAKKDELKGKDIKVQGKVVKYSEGIMGKNWLHLRDGTGEEGTNDITVTTTERSSVGKVVLVSGTLKTDQDMGGGYHYDVIIEDASLTAK